MLRTLGRTLVAAHYAIYQLSLAIICMAFCLYILFDCPLLKAFGFSIVTFASYALGQVLVILARRAARRTFPD